jgi:6-pyruvoyltetrahydropterin/6-carboxytetrahydropterin synthase
MELTVCKEFTFEAAHKLFQHDGKCSHLHGHSYKLHVTVKRDPKVAENVVIGGGSSDGMIIDFSNLKEIVNYHIIEKLDHAYLNDVLPFRPTAENMVLWIADVLSNALKSYKVKVVSIKLWETAGAYAEVSFHD